jgi:lipopolysaccharide export system permease protein
VISQEVNNFAILARGIDEKTNRLSDLTLYDYSTPDKINIVTAKAGKIYFSPDLSKLLIDLENGEIHESQVSGTTYYRKLYFTKHRMAVNADQFSFQQSNDSHRGDRELSAQAMLRYTDSLKQICAGYEETLEEEIGGVFFGKATYTNLSTPSVQTATLDERYHRVLTQLYNDKNAIITSSVHVDDISKEIDKYMVEVHKKYALPVACLVFILLGAPLGVMTRKGGFGMAGSISLFFFIVYWAFLIGGEKLADRGLLTPFWGMWAANVIMGALGVFLLYRSVKETVTLNFAFLRRFVPKNWRSPEEESQ